MNVDLQLLRIKKVAEALRHPFCWRPLASGVVPSVEHLKILRGLSVDGVIDVGANRGQFALACRISLPQIPVVSFEPIPSEAEMFRRVHAQASQVVLIECALGEVAATAVLHLSRRADSSSMLPIGLRQSELFAGTEEIGTIRVPVSRLDDHVTAWGGRLRQLLKIDVQGFELCVLRGAVDTLRSCASVYVECSEIELYEGQALRPEVAAFLARHGFHETGRFNEQFSGTTLIQADYLYERR